MRTFYFVLIGAGVFAAGFCFGRAAEIWSKP
jgi:hypothetical protein